MKNKHSTISQSRKNPRVPGFHTHHCYLLGIALVAGENGVAISPKPQAPTGASNASDNTVWTKSGRNAES